MLTDSCKMADFTDDIGQWDIIADFVSICHEYKNITYLLKKIFSQSYYSYTLGPRPVWRRNRNSTVNADIVEQTGVVEQTKPAADDEKETPALPKERFPHLSDVEKDTLVQQRLSTNTIASTKFGVKVFKG